MCMNNLSAEVQIEWHYKKFFSAFLLHFSENRAQHSAE